MNQKVIISVSQLFVMLFISRVIVNLTYSIYVVDINNMWEHFSSSIIAFVLTIVMTLPVYFLYKTTNNSSVLDTSYNVFSKIGALIVIIYAIYFLWVLCYTISLFDIFVTDLMNPNISSISLSIAVVVASVYGAIKGIEAIGRTSTIIFFAILIVFIFLAVALFPQVNSNNLQPLFYGGAKTTLQGVVFMLGRNSCIPVMAVLISMTKGEKKKIKRGIFFWSFSIYGFSTLFIYLTVGVLGKYYLSTQAFPIYTVASVAQVGIFQRLDAVFLGAWTAGIFIKTSLFIYLVSICVKKIWGEKASKISILIVGAIVLFCSYAVSLSTDAMSILFNNNVLMILTFITALLIPVILLIKINRKGVAKV